MDEHLSAWMDWIRSSRCLALSCTSTQSSHLKWVTGGGINSPRHQTSRWLKAAESSTVRWSDAMIFRASVHPVLLVAASTTHDRWHNCFDAILRCTIGSSGAEEPAARSLLLASTVHPVLLCWSWRVSALFKLDHRIDRRFPPMDRRFIRRCCSSRLFSAIHPTLLKTGPSVQPTVPWLSPSVPTRPTIASTLVI
jgi:hypothetical protein